MNVYSYFEHLNDLALPVIDLWKETWSRHGWNPIVLGESDFKAWPSHAEFDEKVSKLPTVNGFEYERACYRRWGAMVVVGGGLLGDYDVINFGFKPTDLPDCGDKCLMMEAAPGLTLGSKRSFELACEVFMNYIPDASDVYQGKPHTSDMFITDKLLNKGLFERRIIGRQFGDLNWEHSTLVHFPSLVTGPDKAGVIRKHMK